MGIDLSISLFIYNLCNKYKILKIILYYLGLKFHNYYTILGVFFSIFIIIWKRTLFPLFIHILPLLCSYQIIQFIKKNVNKIRPGCSIKSMTQYIDKEYCLNNKKYESFPAGHAGVNSALTFALIINLYYSNNPAFFIFPIKNNTIKYLITIMGILTTISVGLYRIAEGYHSVFDTFAGIIIGGIIGLFIYILYLYV